MSIQLDKFKEIADAIRAKTGETLPLKPSQFANKIEDVYNSGSQSEYDKFWDSYQSNGNRRNYVFAFSGWGWTDENFKPKYPIKITTDGAYLMFCACKIKNINADLLDLTAGGSGSLMFNSSSATIPSGQGVTNITGTLDLTNMRDVSSLFYYCTSLTNVECIKMPKTNVATSNMFGLCTKLKEIRFDTSSGGYIGKSTTFIYSTQLSHDSLISIINALYNYSESGTTYTLTLGTTNLAKLTNEEKAVATLKGWTLA